MRTRSNESAKVNMLLDSIAEIGLLEPVSSRTLTQIDGFRQARCGAKWIQTLSALSGLH